MGGREICGHLSVDLIAYADRNLIQVSQHVQHRKGHICSALNPAAVFGSHTVEPSHSSGTSCGGAVLSSVSAAASQLIRLVSENLADKSACSHCAGVCLADCDNLLDLIWRNSGADSSVRCQGGGRGYHRIDTVIRVLHGTQLSLQQNILSRADSVPEICGHIAHIGSHHFLILHQLLIELVRIESRLVIQIFQKNIFLHAYIRDFITQISLVGKQLAYLETDLCVFI